MSAGYHFIFNYLKMAILFLHKPAIEYFELHRQIDNLVYQFDRVFVENGSYGYKRRDADLWILNDIDKGWVAVDPITGEVTGRPWTVQPEDQLESPPDGEWVSRKGKKSYVYELIYAEKPE